MPCCRQNWSVSRSSCATVSYRANETIRRLSDALARKAGADVTVAGAAEDAAALTAALAERDARLAQETMRRERLERRVEAVLAERDQAKREREQSERAGETLRTELALIEKQIATLLQQDYDRPAGALDLRSLTVLYVGGRAHQAPQLRSLVERANGRFLHHDGGLEHNAALLPGLVSRADVVAFPVDCVSHDAVASLKRACRQLGKHYLPLRTSSLACLLSALAASPFEAAAVADTAPA